MSTLTFSSSAATDRASVERATVEQAKALPAAAGSLSTVIKGLKALGEGFTAYRRYEMLRARGVPHSVAAAKAFEA